MSAVISRENTKKQFKKKKGGGAKRQRETPITKIKI